MRHVIARAGRLGAARHYGVADHGWVTLSSGDEWLLAVCVRAGELES